MKNPTLKMLRQARGMTILELSEATRIPWSTLQALESGRGRGFNVETKQKLADYFKVHLGDLFPEEAKKRILARMEAFTPDDDEKKWKAAWEELKRLGRG